MVPLSQVCIFTSICAEDRHWVPQYLAEIERLGTYFAIHQDRCQVPELTNHRRCAFFTHHPGPESFIEPHKQPIFNKVASSGRFRWAAALDMDELFASAPSYDVNELLPKALGAAERQGHSLVKCRWLNMWNSTQQVRIDGPFNGTRSKFLRLSPEISWRWRAAVVNGPTAFATSISPPKTLDVTEYYAPEIVCLHAGMMTREQREFHKLRWDTLYTAAVGSNPYGFWNYALDEMAYPPTLIDNVFLR